jgi:osmotically-inducible protein OsmY
MARRTADAALLGTAAGVLIRAFRGRSALAARGDEDVPDDLLADRVRREAEVPGGVEVAAEAGAVVLFGRVPRYLVDRLLQRVSEVEGVRDVEDRLTRVDLVAPERPPGPPDRP